jgi:hypothetical protein
MTTRYTLADQVHFLATIAGKGEVVVTLQQWQAAGPKAVYVVTHNGVEATRKFTDDQRDIDSLQAYIATSRQQHAADVLSDDAAVDEVVRRGGPKPAYCLKGDCPSSLPIPFAAAHCAAGCLPPADRGGLEFMSVTSRRPVVTVVTGGKK